MDEESYTSEVIKGEDVTIMCKCLFSDIPSESETVPLSARKQMVLSTVIRTENYLRERRIPELIRYFLTKLVAHKSEKPISFLEQLLDECMLFRAGHGSAPVLFEPRHLNALIKSFDPGERGWLSAGQIRRLYATLGISLEISPEAKMPIYKVFTNVSKAQEDELFSLITAGLIVDSVTNTAHFNENN